MRSGCLAGVLLLVTGIPPAFAAGQWVSESPGAGTFPLVQGGRAATLVHDPADHRVVAIATQDLSADIERVTGVRPVVQSAPSAELAGPTVIVGTLGRSRVIDDFVRRRQLDVRELAGAWESFVIATVPGDRARRAAGPTLVIVGSDRRGTAFGIYELAQAIGVSPWYWWADVAPDAKRELHVAAGRRRVGPPSVKYRGIFINDEDWGLHPWAARTFDPGRGDIGPKTYAKIFELLLRLKANICWPAMHEVTGAFNSYPENRQLADDYAIVMGSSHAEPMLRNNVTEWTAPPAEFNYTTNHDGVLAYWNERVRENARFENIYTLGMRGIHDSPMQGAATVADRVAALERIFADQRELLARHVNPAVDRVPQVFTPYKEVLDIYRAGLRVPDDVTIVWPDDNHGYIRDFPNDNEGRRAGGFGVYLPSLVSRGAARLPLALHHAPGARPGGTDEGTRARRANAVDRECRRHQAGGNRDRAVPATGVGRRSVAEGACARISRRMGGARVRRAARPRHRPRDERLLRAQSPAASGAPPVVVERRAHPSERVDAGRNHRAARAIRGAGRRGRTHANTSALGETGRVLRTGGVSDPGVGARQRAVLRR